MRLLIASAAPVEAGAIPRIWGFGSDVDVVGEALESRGHSVSSVVFADASSLLRHLAREPCDLVLPNAYRMRDGAGDRYMAQVLDQRAQPYVGSGYPAIRAEAKSHWKDLLDAAGVPTPRWVSLFPGMPVGRRAAALSRLRAPLIVKPDLGAESIGVRVVDSVEHVERYVDGPSVVEEFSHAGEYTVAVVGNEEGIQCWPVAISVPDGYRFTTEEIKSARLRQTIHVIDSPERRRAITELARAAFLAAGLSDWARVDIVRTTTGELVVVDLNALPGLRTDPEHPSYLPIAARLAGDHDLGALMSLLIDASARRWGIEGRSTMSEPHAQARLEGAR